MSSTAEEQNAPGPVLDMGPTPMRVILGRVFTLAWPAMMQAFMATVVFFADRLMLGNHDAKELAALIPSGTMLWSITSIFGVWTIGTLAVVARDKGAGRMEAVKRHVATSILMSLSLGALVAGLGNVFAPQLVAFFGVTPAVAAAGEAYLRILLCAMPLTFAALSLMSAFTGAGDTLTPMIASGVSNAVNVAGNYVLIFGHFGFPEMGMRGAAIASASAFGVFALLEVSFLFRKRSLLPLRARDLLGVSRASAVRILRVSMPAALERFIFHAGFIGFARVVTALGTLAMAAQEALIAVQSVVFLPGEGFGIAAGSIMGRALGAGKAEDARRGAKVAVWMAVTPLVLAGVVFILVPERLVGLFTDDVRIIWIGVPALIIGAFEGLFLGTFQVLSGGMRGAGDTRTPMLVTALGVWAVRIPLCAFFGLAPEQFFGIGLGLGLRGVWMGTLIDWIVRATLITIAFKRGRWRRMKV